MEISLQEWAMLVAAFVPKLLSALVIFGVGWYLAVWLGKLVERLLQRRKVDREIALLLRRATQWGVFAASTLMALDQVGFDITTFLAGLGALGFALGFAVQDITQNLMAGVLLLLQQPFDIGDAIQVGDYAGVVLDINLRATEMRTWDGRRVYVPNAQVYTSAIVNYSRSEARRIGITLGVAYDTDLPHAQQVALEAVRRLPGVKEDPAPTVVFHTFGESSVDFTVYYWINPRETDYFAAQTAGVQALHRAFQEAGIDIPFPIRTVYLQKGE